MKTPPMALAPAMLLLPSGSCLEKVIHRKRHQVREKHESEKLTPSLSSLPKSKESSRNAILVSTETGMNEIESAKAYAAGVI